MLCYMILSIVFIEYIMAGGRRPTLGFGRPVGAVGAAIDRAGLSLFPGWRVDDSFLKLYIYIYIYIYIVLDMIYIVLHVYVCMYVYIYIYIYI